MLCSTCCWLCSASPVCWARQRYSDQVAQLFALGWALWLEWFAFRLTLGIGIVAAAGLVALDVAIGVLLAAISLPFAPGS